MTSSRALRAYRINLRAVLLASGSLLGLATGSALAAVQDYPAGSTNSNPIVLTDNSTQLQVLTGSATQAGAISESGGSFGLAKIGSGTLVLTGANNYTGTTTISQGTLNVGGGGATGTLFGNLADNGTFVMNRSDTLGFNGVISGTGSVVVASGSNAFRGDNTYTGGTTINAGASLNLGAGTNAGSVVGNILDNGALAFQHPVAVTYAGAITGTGSVTDIGVGVLTLTGANNYSGGTTINSGATLNVGGGGTTGGLFGDMTDNGSFVMNRSDRLGFNGVISGTGNVVVASGSNAFQGNNTYTGGTTINAGAALQLGVSGTSGSVVGNVTDNG